MSLKELFCSADLLAQCESKEIMVVMVSTTWCKVCKKFQPMFEKYAQTYRGNFCLIPQLDKWPKKDRALLPFEIHKYPRFVFLQNGEVLKVSKRSNLEKYLSKYC